MILVHPNQLNMLSFAWFTWFHEDKQENCFISFDDCCPSKSIFSCYLILIRFFGVGNVQVATAIARSYPTKGSIHFHAIPWSQRWFPWRYRISTTRQPEADRICMNLPGISRLFTFRKIPSLWTLLFHIYVLISSVCCLETPRQHFGLSINKCVPTNYQETYSFVVGKPMIRLSHPCILLPLVFPTITDVSPRYLVFLSILSVHQYQLDINFLTSSSTSINQLKKASL